MKKLFRLVILGTFILIILVTQTVDARDCKPSNVQTLNALAEALKPKPEPKNAKLK